MNPPRSAGSTSHARAGKTRWRRCSGIFSSGRSKSEGWIGEPLPLRLRTASMIVRGSIVS